MNKRGRQKCASENFKKNDRDIRRSYICVCGVVDSEQMETGSTITYNPVLYNRRISGKNRDDM